MMMVVRLAIRLAGERRGMVYLLRRGLFFSISNAVCTRSMPIGLLLAKCYPCSTFSVYSLVIVTL